MDTIRSECQAFSNEQLIFSHCTFAVDPQPYVNTCLRDMCECAVNNGGDHLETCEHWRCESATQLSRACAHKGVVLDWRTSMSCRKNN